MNEDIIGMTGKELERYRLIRKVLERGLTQREASSLLGVTERQIRRLVKRVRANGAKGLIHRSRGKPSGRRIRDGIKDRIERILRSRYPDFPPTFAAEKLAEREGITINRETLRQLMLERGLWTRRRQRAEAHLWRERKAHVGELVQMDGSHHAWLEERGPALVLMGYVDDATGRCFGRFYDHEGLWPALDSLRRYLGRYGRPQTLYLDRHSTYKTVREPNQEEMLRGEQAKTQFERACEELGIKVIHALSPQAKGRVERVFGTLQERLVREMRLASIQTPEEANRFLERYLVGYNERFAKAPLKAEDLHRPVPSGLVLDDILCLKEIRTILNGGLVKWRGRLLVLERPRHRLIGEKVVVMVDDRGRLRLRYQTEDLAYRKVSVAPSKPALKPVVVRVYRRRPKYVPAPTHPWRLSRLGCK
jgi:transposase